MGAIWTTKEGMKIPVSEMTDDHIRHVIRFIRRRSHRRFISSSLAILANMSDEDGSAEFAFMSYVEDPEIREPITAPYGDPYRDTPVFLDLIRELRRRNLKELSVLV